MPPPPPSAQAIFFLSLVYRIVLYPKLPFEPFFGFSCVSPSVVAFVPPWLGQTSVVLKIENIVSTIVSVRESRFVFIKFKASILGKIPNF